MNDLSPGVERAVEAAGSSPTIVDWLQILLADDDGRPAMLVASLGLSSAVMLSQLEAARSHVVTSDILLRLAREHSIRLKADPSFTTDFLLVAALFHDPILAEALGVRLAHLESCLRSPMVEASPSLQTPSAEFLLPDVTDRSDAARIVDASLNRAREALRVLDDYARFVRNDATMTAAVKTLRHRLADLGSGLPLLASRNTPGDVGTGIGTSGEYDRGSPAHVAAVNCKRLQEALRSIEEYGKLLSVHLGHEAESIRYETYTLERSLLGGSPLRDRLIESRLYLIISGEGSAASLDWTIAESINGGVSIVQLREKKLCDRELLERAIQVREWTRKGHALFIMNDRPDIARLAGADGVHLGQDDLAVSDARRILGHGPLIGVSTHNAEQVRQAVRDGADYLGVGPCFPSSTKKTETLAGLDFIRAASELTTLPQFALGGINATTITSAVDAGAQRVAVSAAIIASDEPRLAATQIRSVLA